MIAIKLHILRDDFELPVDLELPLQGTTAFYGASGSGKTSLLRAIAGLDIYPHGFLQVGEEVWQQGKKCLPTHKRALAYVFQEANLFAHLSVSANLEYGMRRLPESERSVSLGQAIELLGIGHLLQRRPYQLSGGERQRVAIARALAVSPRLLLMDEPLSGLDAKRKHEVIPYISALQQELAIPVIYVSHNLDEIVRLADHMVVLGEKGIEASGPVASTLTRLDLSLAHEYEALALIEAEVKAHDDHFHLTALSFSGGEIVVPRQALQPGDKVRVQLAARDVSLTATRQHDTSILNIFPVTVDGVDDEDAAQVTVRLMAVGTALLSRITRKSAAELGVRVGKQFYAQVKTVALLQ